MRAEEVGDQMDEESQAQQALKEMFRRDRAEVAAHPPRKPRLRDSSRTLAWVVGVVVFVVVLLPVTFIVVYPRFGPVDTMNSFCLAEEDGEYASAYALLSKGAQQRVSLTDFTNESRSVTLVSCSVSGGIPFIFNQSKATLDVDYSLLEGGSSTDENGTMSFVHESGGWRVDSTSLVII